MQEHGFTKIELLIALGVIAVIGVLAAFGVSAARSKQRDAVRISEVRQLQSALEDFFNEQNRYPSAEGLLPLGDARVSACLSGNGFEGDCTGQKGVHLLTVLPTIDTGLSNLSVCGTPSRNAFCYVFVREGAEYRIQFELENDWPASGLIDGVNCASPDGLSGGACRI